MNKRINLILFLIMTLTVSVSAVSAQTELFAPDLAEAAIDTLAIVCQNVNDYSSSLLLGTPVNHQTSLESYQKALVNLEYLLGKAGKDYVDRLAAVQSYFTTDLDEIGIVESECLGVRRELQTAVRNQSGGLNFQFQPITTFAECAAAGYFVNDGVCFMNGNLAYDTNGYLIGRYNTDCFDAESYYPNSCWYCIYGNNAEGCNARPW